MAYEWKADSPYLVRLVGRSQQALKEVDREYAGGRGAGSLQCSSTGGAARLLDCLTAKAAGQASPDARTSVSTIPPRRCAADCRGGDGTVGL